MQERGIVRSMTKYIWTGEAVHVYLDGQMRTVPAEDRSYVEVIRAIQRDASETEIAAILEKDLRRVKEAVEALQHKSITAGVTLNGGQVMFRGESIHNSLTTRMLKQLDEGFDLVPMARFLENLLQNPSYRAVEDLYTFLEFGKMPITPDGHFLAYRAVAPDYRDIRTGLIDNSIGCKPSMPRNKVDEDPNRTCSHGFHACSFDYLPHYAHANGHVMIVKINPCDVVAIPRDYNNTKMRISTYEVVDEYRDYYSKNRANVLAEVTVATEEEPFLVLVSGTQPETLRFGKLIDAAAKVDAAVRLSSTESVVLKNGLTDSVIEERENENFEGYSEFDGDDDDEDEDEDLDVVAAEEDGYRIVYAELTGDIGKPDLPVHDTSPDLEEAKDLALEFHKLHPTWSVQVRDTRTGAVKLTLQVH
jgi:hypothetical protein